MLQGERHQLPLQTDTATNTRQHPNFTKNILSSSPSRAKRLVSSKPATRRYLSACFVIPILFHQKYSSQVFNGFIDV